MDSGPDMFGRDGETGLPFCKVWEAFHDLIAHLPTGFLSSLGSPEAPCNFYSGISSIYCKVSLLLNGELLKGRA